MVQTYKIFGANIGSHYLAMGVLGTMFAGSYLALGGSKAKPATPPINAASSDEADFIKNFIDQAEADEKKNAPAKH
ncbi:hypothetical protein B0J18DRAFT_31793 [Chaetomium sp. MPI-SDFR-AT-0129]|uniref:ATP synthase subunit K, mitochondrial n=1 Tax=Dichotomopilus funicola TaxID=1934379 RepID=A0AAN6V5Q9_9PEZI|nr:hypothetical protein B0J18DRAFT_31793 [Chaetomium sp. MPI-SDFR-AT-0129]KAK4144540.1 hypothetical protein C8A04DRAFT_27726 [Dichotomopilus funicola]